MKTCKIKDCRNKHLAKGLCNKHYRRMQRNGVCDYEPKPSMYRHGMYKSKEYRAWLGMKARCYNKSHPSYKNYGGRGILVCQRWISSFKDFYKDMGNSPTNEHQLDRTDNERGYCMENCKWVTRKENNRNRRNNRLITHNKETKTLTEWSEILKIDKRRLGERLDKCADDDQTDEIIEKLLTLLQ